MTLGRLPFLRMRSPQCADIPEIRWNRRDTRQEHMDASNRSCHVYGKTQSGKRAFKSARGALPSAARQLWILIDGQRTLEDLSSILGAEAVERSLVLLEARGYVELVRHFPEVDGSPTDTAAPPSPEVPVEQPHSAPRRRSAVPIVLGVLAVTIGIAWPPLRGMFERTSQSVPAPVAPPVSAPAAVEAPSPAPAVRAPARSPPPVRDDQPHVQARTTGPAPTPQTATPRPEVAATPVPSEPSTATASPAPALHVRSQMTPQIPQQAKDLGIKTGRVVVVLHVNPDGTVKRVELVSAAPPQVYDQEMQQAFEKWTFDPPGVPGRMTVQVDVVPHN